MQLYNYVILKVIAAVLSILFSASVIAAIPTKKVVALYTLTKAGKSSLSKPSDVAVTKDYIYVVDGDNHRIVVYNKQGHYLKQFGKFGAGKGEFNSPVGLGLDTEGNVYVADTKNHRIQIFDEDGTYEKLIKIKVDGQPARPVDIAISKDNRKIYVTTKTNSILILKQNGKKVKKIGRTGTDKGEFRFPATITTMSHGRIAAIDVLNFRLQVFSKHGKFSYQVGNFGVRPGQFIRPKGVAIAPDSKIYISDSYMDVIQVFSNKGRFLHVLGNAGKPRRVTAPAGIAVDKSKRLYIAETYADRISVFQLD